jgi:ribosomal protein L20
LTLHIAGSQTRQQKRVVWRLCAGSFQQRLRRVQFPKKQVHGGQVDAGVDLQCCRDQHRQRLARRLWLAQMSLARASSTCSAGEITGRL